MSFKFVDGGVCAAKGFKASGIWCGIRANRTKRDLALIVSEAPCAAAAIYTQNKVKVFNSKGQQISSKKL